MTALKVTIKGFRSLEKVLKKEQLRQKKALDVSVKVEGFRLMRQLKKEVRQGSPGGKQFDPLSFMERFWRLKTRMKPDKPLTKLSGMVRYLYKRKDPFEMHVGWVGTNINERWRKIIVKMQEGFSANLPEYKRQQFRSIADDLGKRSKGKKFLYVKDATTKFITPARPVIDPFWKDEKGRAWKNIQRNYRLKMKGKKI